MKWGNKPVIVLGHGMRAAGADARPLLDLGVPILSSWQGADLVDNRHPMYFGRPGIYGQRCANRVLYEADQIIAIGNRMSLWQIGHAGLRPDQELVMVDVDACEVMKFSDAVWMNDDAASFCTRLVGAQIRADDGYVRPVDCSEWLAQCVAWREQYPWVESPAHDDLNGFINSYRFIEHLETLLRPDEVVITDVGANMCPVFQALHVAPPQRLITSGGLGEMGCALPMAIGASFARGRGEVLCIVGDGGMMMNLQELQTIVHHRLPIKMIVFENDGYGMIKGTHRNIGIPYTGVTKSSGISHPDFCRIADALDIGTCDVRSWDAAKRWLPVMLESKGPFLMQVHIDPEQEYVPRLKPIIRDGAITPARFDQLSPVDA